MTEPATHSHPDRDDHGHFMRLFSEHHQRVYAFIHSLVLDRADADEVFQETSVVLWRAFGDFRPEGNFLNWACGVALNQVRRFRRQRGRDRLVFSEPLLEMLAQDRAKREDRADLRRAALARCMRKLRGIDRTLVESCYGSGDSFKDIADQLSKPVNTVYHALSRIRRALHECIDRQVRKEVEA